MDQVGVIEECSEASGGRNAQRGHTYLFGAICPARDTGAALAMLYADTKAMQLRLEEISRAVVRGAHAVLLLAHADCKDDPEPGRTTPSKKGPTQ